jgi:hypothetical protein
MGSIDCDDSTGEFCEIATYVSNRVSAKLGCEGSPLQNPLRRNPSKHPVDGDCSRLLLSSDVDNPFLLEVIISHEQK